MKGLKGAVVFAQSGGPTSVINASAAGVFIEGLKSDMITNVYCAAHGIRGILNEEMYDISKEDISFPSLLVNELLCNTADFIIILSFSHILLRIKLVIALPTILHLTKVVLNSSPSFLNV